MLVSIQMQMWLLLATASCLIVLSTARQPPVNNPNESERNGDSNNDYNRPNYDQSSNNRPNYDQSSYNRPSYNRPDYNNNNKKPAVPMELHFNFTFPENGLPPLKLNMGVVSQYLDEMSKKISDGSSVPSKMRKTLLVRIKNPNKPVKPIPAEVFAAGLPKGAMIPGDVVKPCRKFIVSTCNILCTVQQSSCRSICDGRIDCLAGCEVSLRTCSSFCDSTFSQLDAKLKEAANVLKGTLDSVVGRVPLIDEFQNEIPDFNFYLPKCLQNCGYNATCINHCHYVCHSVWEKPTAQYAPQYLPTAVHYARPFVPALPSGYSIGSGIREGDDSDGLSKSNDELLKDDAPDTESAQR